MNEICMEGILMKKQLWILIAAAMLAASHFLAARTAGVKSFTVGAVTVTSGGEGTDAADLRTQAELLMRPFCTGALGFLGVRA